MNSKNVISSSAWIPVKHEKYIKMPTGNKNQNSQNRPFFILRVLYPHHPCDHQPEGRYCPAM